jgi:hypothetical protein
MGSLAEESRLDGGMAKPVRLDLRIVWRTT